MIINMNGAKAPETPSSVLQEKTVTPETLPTVIGPDDPSTKEVPARGSALAAVNAEALAEVDAREAAGEEEKAAAAALVGANAVTGSFLSSGPESQSRGR